MRKIFANLKSVVALAVVAAMTLSVSCMYDDTALTKRVNKVEKDLAALTERVNALENKSINDLLNGAAVITGYAKDEAGNVTLTLSNGETVTVLAEAETLQYRVTDGVLEISADGQTWVAVTAAPDAVVKKAVVNEDGTVTITLADGTEFTVAKAELIECEATRSGVYVPAGESKDVRITINDAVVDINIMNQPLGWSASVEEYVEVEDDDFGGGFMPLAVGGKDYVIRINAPAASFEAAATEGVVSVHFNTAAGACKVLSINVNLAKLALEIDKQGNITIVNSLVEMKRSMIFGEYEDFANFFLGVVYKSDFEELGGVEDIINYGLPYAMIARDNLVNLFNKPYEEGVYEEDVTKFTFEELLAEFASVGVNDVTYTIGNDYVVFIAMANKIGEVDLNRVVEALDYTALKVAAEKVEGSETWNGADYKFTFMGYDAAIIGYVPQYQVDMYIESGQCSDLDSFYDLYIAEAENYGFPAIGSPITFDMGPWENQLITAAELSQFYGAILPNTEYRLYALCLNMEDVGVKTFTHEDIYDFGTFTTTNLEAGDFAVVAESELVSWGEYGVEANITLSENVTLSTYDIYYEPAMDVETRVNEMMENAYFQPNPMINIYQYVGDADEFYVAIIGVNAYGQYAYEEVKFSLEPEQPAEPVDVVATGAAARYDSNNSYATIVDFQLPNEETASVAFRTGDGGWDMDLCFNKGLNYINAGQWNTYGDKGTSPVWYTNAYLNGSQAEVKGAIEVGYADGAYSFTFSIGNYNVTYTGAVEGLVEPEVTSADLEQPEEGGESVDRSNINFVLCTEEGVAPVVYAGSGYCDFALWDGEKNFIRIELNDEGGYPVNGKTYPFSPDNGYDFGTMSGNGVWVCLNGVAPYSLPEYNAIVPTSGTLDVTVTDGVYTMVLDFVLPDGSKFGGTFEGAIDFK